MAVLTLAAFISKWTTRFADNSTREIDESDMREFAEDIKDSFQSIAGATAISSWKDPCAVATTANITLSGEQTIDGVLTSGSRVLVKDQASADENGIYVSAAGAWSRATDSDDTAELEGAAVGVTGGTVNQNTIWLQTTDNPTVDTDALVWQQIGFGVVPSASTTVVTKRVATGTVGASSELDVTVTWDTPFADTNYTVICQMEYTGVVNFTSFRVDHMKAKTTDEIVVRVINSSGAGKDGIIHAMAIHD